MRGREHPKRNEVLHKARIQPPTDGDGVPEVQQNTPLRGYWGEVGVMGEMERDGWWGWGWLKKARFMRVTDSGLGYLISGAFQSIDSSFGGYSMR